MKKIILLSLIFIVNFSIAQKNQKLDSLFKKLAENKEFNGNVLIAEKGKIIYKNSFGLANEKTKEKLNENSIFELASVSKQFTAFAIVILKDKGKLNYDDKIGKFIPELDFYKNITIKNLLNHTSGLPDYMSLLDSLLIDETWNNKTKIATNKDIINVFSLNKPTLLFEPNEKWQYSNTGYALLASIIEKASGITYAEFLKKEIFDPLKMNNTFVYTRRAKPRNIKNYAFGYVYSDSLKTNVLPDEIKDLNYVYSLDGIVGDGTVNSTIIDLLKWDKALYQNNLVKEKSLEEIFQSSILNDKALTKYGFGWNIEENGLYGKISYHGGSWPGYKTYIERHLDNEKLIILLQNNDNQNIWFPTKQVREILYDIKPISYIELKKEKLKSLEGEYKFINKDLIRKILFKNNILYVEIYGDEMELKPISQNKFHLIGFSPDVFFEFINKNNVEMLIETQPEMKILMEAEKK